MKLLRPYLGLALLLWGSSVLAQTPTAMDYIVAIAGEQGIGVRPAGSAGEQLTAEYIEQQWINQGLTPYTNSFNINDDKMSKNVIVDIKGKAEKTLIIAAHYDSTGEKEG
uniref:hypothetical protein n=1 Tax=Paraglaciecola sp. TaxID=1920173 RepID=UPI0030F396E2